MAPGFEEKFLHKVYVASGSTSSLQVCMSKVHDDTSRAGRRGGLTTRAFGQCPVGR